PDRRVARDLREAQSVQRRNSLRRRQRRPRRGRRQRHGRKARTARARAGILGDCEALAVSSGSRAIAAVATMSLLGAYAAAAPPMPKEVSKDTMNQTIQKLETELAGKYGESERPRIRQGLAQAAEFW